MNAKIIASVALLALAGAGGYLFVQSAGSADMPGMDHSAMSMGKTAVENASEATKSYEATMATMMKAMMMPMTGKPDLDFVQGMTPHHEGAVAMAKTVLQFGKDPEIKTFAEAVIKAQEGEIAVMKDWLAKTDQAALPIITDSAKANEQAMAVMMKNMVADYSGDADIDFVKGMLPHHQGAIDMAKIALQFVKDPTLLKLASEITAAQTSEITFMNSWLNKNGK